jgi:hypothetical protein
MKNKGVCKGCKYYQKKSSMPIFNNTCDYMGQTGRSRLKIELDNGGVKKDSCICYEAGKRTRRAKNAKN